MAALRPIEPFRCTALLTARRARFSRRSRRLVIASVVFHVVLLVLVIIVSPRHSQDEDEFLHFDVVFRSPLPPEPEPLPPAPKPVHLPKPKLAQPKLPTPRPEAPIVVAPQVEPAPRPVVKLPPSVVAAAPERPRPARVVQKAAGFEAAPADTPRPRDVPRVVADGGFGQATAAVSRTRMLPPQTAILAGGFASTTQAPAPGAGRIHGTVTSPGFDTAAGGGAPKHGVPGIVKPGGFGEGVGAAPPSRQSRELRQPVASRDTPVEIVSKPKPTYTDEARQLRLEGEVVVEVTFIASGQLRVLRVLAGLGHGLDEAAVEAVQKIRFTPARQDGHPVDQTTTLRVVFRLA